MLQAEDNRQHAATELATREQELADARKKVERLQRGAGGDKHPRARAEPAAHEQALASAGQQVDPVRRVEAERYPLLAVGCALAALAGIGLITGATLALTVDTAHVTTAGVVAAVSAAGMFAVVWVAFVANWYRKHSLPSQDETPATSNGSHLKPQASKQASTVRRTS